MRAALGKTLLLTVVILGTYACQVEPKTGPEASPGPGATEATPVRSVGPAPAVVSATTEGCQGDDSLTILLDGAECADPGFVAGGAQPAAMIRVTEPGGGTGVLLIDVGESPDALEVNLRRWIQGQGLATLAQDDDVLKSIMFSHVHTFDRVMTPPWGFGDAEVAESLRLAWEFIGDVSVQGPNLGDLCSDAVKVAGDPVARKLCEAPLREIERGLTPVRYANGVASRRAWTLTYPIAPQERKDLSFQPLESVFVFRSMGGYLVYSVCSHAHQPGQETHSHRPFHAIELVQQYIETGDLRSGPIHSLVTGACGMEQMLTEYNKGQPVFISENPGLLTDRLAAMAKRTGLKNVYLSHCAQHFQQFWPMFIEVFGDRVGRALPGSCIPL